jgi:hypothetical protein
VCFIKLLCNENRVDFFEIGKPLKDRPSVGGSRSRRKRDDFGGALDLTRGDPDHGFRGCDSLVGELDRTSEKAAPEMLP